jgi:hypothetical protein
LTHSKGVNGMNYENSRRVETAGIIAAAMIFAAGLFAMGMGINRAELAKADSVKAMADAYIKSLDAYEVALQNGASWGWKNPALMPLVVE